MIITDLISITELSRLTNKSRPTLYKYVNDFSLRKFDEIPYSFIVLFKMIEEHNTSKRDIIEYCEKNYSCSSHKYDQELSEIIELLNANREKIDLSKIKTFIEENLKK